MAILNSRVDPDALSYYLLFSCIHSHVELDKSYIAFEQHIRDTYAYHTKIRQGVNSRINNKRKGQS